VGFHAGGGVCGRGSTISCFCSLKPALLGDRGSPKQRPARTGAAQDHRRSASPPWLAASTRAPGWPICSPHVPRSFQPAASQGRLAFRHHRADSYYGGSDEMHPASTLIPKTADSEGGLTFRAGYVQPSNSQTRQA
jgi:hypothetical protein